MCSILKGNIKGVRIMALIQAWDEIYTSDISMERTTLIFYSTHNFMWNSCALIWHTETKQSMENRGSCSERRACNRTFIIWNLMGTNQDIQITTEIPLSLNMDNKSASTGRDIFLDVKCRKRHNSMIKTATSIVPGKHCRWWIGVCLLQQGTSILQKSFKTYLLGHTW